ncbi:MAG TPA: DUF3288 domain-containing protein [Synechococcales bacterium UBA10510]|nr:DUF3288 domain-containing protein [Synechococcales bacterium UBA10510]
MSKSPRSPSGKPSAGQPSAGKSSAGQVDGSAADQTHPLYALDRDLVDGLLACAQPGDAQLVDAARLLMRYEGFPGARDIGDDLAKLLRLWGLDRERLHERTRVIWAAGYRPAPAAAEAVGSGFDTADEQPS